MKLIYLIIFFILSTLVCYSDEIETIQTTVNALHKKALKSGLSESNKIILSNIQKHAVNNEELFRISKLSFGLLFNKAWIIPFILLLLVIAFAPLILPHWWEKNLNKGIISFILSLPVVYMIYNFDYRFLLHSGKEYISFIILIGSLFVISGGIYLHGRMVVSPLRNTIFLMFGAILANFIGTTGTAMVLFRPFIRANKHRSEKIHLIIFFIFIVCNIGGLLTPLGDPPLFLGFIRGVPFQWTFRMFPHWLFVNGVLLTIFLMIDSRYFNPMTNIDQPAKIPLAFHGKMNFIFLGGIIAVTFLSGYFHLPFGVQETGMLIMTIFSLYYSPLSSHERKGNGFTFGPFVEVAVLFAGIFATMIPCLILLETWGMKFHITSPAQFFWVSGLLSQFLDNAPTYLTFSSLASCFAGTDATCLNQLICHPQGMLNLIAISCGSVFMGANTYIGNAPNFMVKALAEEHGIKMPSFFGYMRWSICILFPVYILFTKIFF